MNPAVESVAMVNGEPYPHLPNAPIVEAVIDWRTKPGPNVVLTELRRHALERIAPQYGFLDEQRGFQLVVQQMAGQAQQISTDLGVQGYRFSSADKLQIATFKPDGFSFSRLKPYIEWNSVFAEADRLWNIYRSIAQPEEVSRIATRYVNRILFPLPITEFSEYLNAPPAIPPGAPPVLTSSLSRVTLHEPPTGISANVTQVIEGPVEGRLPFILDIDPYIAQSMNPNAPDITSKFAALRAMKNRMFFAALTNAAINMFR